MGEEPARAAEQISPDGRWRWNGQRWLPIPPPPPVPSMTPRTYYNPSPPTRRGFFGLVEGLTWWEVTLCLIPFAMVPFSGIAGFVLAMGALTANRALARQRLPALVKAPLMVVVVGLAIGLRVGFGVVLFNLTRVG